MKLNQSLLLLLAVVIFSGCLKSTHDLYPEDPDLRSIPVYIVSHGWHAGIAIESEYIVNQIPDHPDMPDTNYLKFGWGDARYYSDLEAGFWLMMRAALLPTKSAVHIVGFDSPVEHYFSGSKVVKIKITEEGASELGKFVRESIKVDDNDQPIFYGEGLYRNSLFFESDRTYILPRTSNKWTAKALRKTGYPISPFYAFTSDNVIQQASKEGTVIQE
ncbi:DUF2459 domain-containing protein [Rhodohalobacter barkolensis]|uniref:DUF2459 domain-containing protein n=1 Tax=Rhodohalobacter barkolensis TaxID=2053187 RepID=A0A2N0VHH6_9BACT|nr:DUF2459 domain-containing protein [Rhodohalobacter barkolensis]PKD43639.1 hypothetical protein CWD77_08720 [Rhodohalobacter barkolensis]